MLKKITIAGAVAAGVLSAGSVLSAHAATVTVAVAKPKSRCHLHKAGTTWSCVTPGAHCTTAAHGQSGTASTGTQQYRCIKYSDGKWRWFKA
ncbi:MAG: hypothetical protein QOE54_7284 [Streptosporangiaceae bacterium]|jgi:hypothetical protein|nr:hypothetical protein [Streptosporangiaceae bacterium]MDX6434918.1 hypothetical protein [Streptosporangiaceae bacterium]